MKLTKILKNAAMITATAIGFNYLMYGMFNINYQHIADKSGEGIARIEAEGILKELQKFQSAFPVAGKVFTYGMEKASENWSQK